VVPLAASSSDTLNLDPTLATAFSRDLPTQMSSYPRQYNVRVRGKRCVVSQASGDLIAAEGYLQHAEHYNRLIAAAEEQRDLPNS